MMNIKIVLVLVLEHQLRVKMVAMQMVLPMVVLVKTDVDVDVEDPCGDDEDASFDQVFDESDGMARTDSIKHAGADVAKTFFSRMAGQDLSAKSQTYAQNTIICVLFLRSIFIIFTIIVINTSIDPQHYQQHQHEQSIATS